eukprot:jgi/Hompol1/1158/HPOL_004472-RA
MVTRQQLDDRLRQDQEEKFRTTSELLNQLRYKSEASLLKANQVGNEFYAKAKEWEGESRRVGDVIRGVKELDQALGSVKTSMDTTSEAIVRRVETSAAEIRQRIEAESRNRSLFEENIRGVCSETRKALQQQDHDIIDRVEGLRQLMTQLIERDRQERDKMVADMLETIRSHERSTRESQSQLLERVSQQLLTLDAVLGDERQARKVLESQVQSIIEEGFKIIQQSVIKRAEETQQQQYELRANMTSAIKSLQESIVLIEKTMDQKLASVEDVLRAEIKSRMETDTAVANL